MAISDGLRRASISGNPGTRNRSGAMNRNCSVPSRYARQASRAASRDNPE